MFELSSHTVFINRPTQIRKTKKYFDLFICNQMFGNWAYHKYALILNGIFLSTSDYNNMNNKAIRNAISIWKILQEDDKTTKQFPWEWVFNAGVSQLFLCRLSHLHMKKYTIISHKGAF